MAVTNPTAVKFCNEKIRIAADRFLQAANFASVVIEEWNSVEMSPGVTLAAGIPNDGAEQVFDGAESDGRAIIAGDDVHNIVNRCTELLQLVDGTAAISQVDRRATLTKVSVNPVR